MIEAKEVYYTYPCGHGLEKIDLKVKPGEFIGIIGPNGSGKSTFLKNVYRELKPSQGAIWLHGKELKDYAYKDSALEMAVLGQEQDFTYAYTVQEMIEMGRYPHQKRFRKEDPSKIIEQAVRISGIEDLLEKSFFQLSGGEKQRVLLTRAIVQDTPLLILDEPTNHLDIFYQLQVFDLVKTLNKTVLAAIHDLNIASLYCDSLYVFKQGKIYSHGPVEKVLNEKMIEDVFGIHSKIIEHPQTKKPWIIYLMEENT